MSVDPRYHDPVLGVAFDLDGTLVLSPHAFPKMRSELIRIAEAHGVPPGHLDARRTIPALLDDAVRELERVGVRPGLRYMMEAEVNRRIDELELEALPSTVPRGGALELLRTLTERGYRLGLLTRSSARFTREALRRTGLLPYLPVLRTRSDDGPAKPDPEALRILLQTMEVPPQRAIFVGDHLLDAECAHGAQVRFYAVLPEGPGAPDAEVGRFQAAGATAIAQDLRELAGQLGLGAPALT